MFKLAVCILVLIAVVGADYDFQDSDFNKLLVDDLTEEEPQRFKRDAENDVEPTECKGSKDWDYHCCSGGKPNVELLKEIKEVKKNCIAEVRGDSADEISYDPLTCGGVESRRQQMVCVGECIAKKFDLLARSGDMIKENLLEHSRKIIGDHKWKAGVLEEYVDKCFSELKPSQELHKDGEPDTCNPSPLQFHHCIWREFVKGCPAESQIDSLKCTKIRERLSKGDAFNGGRYFKHRFHSVY